MLISVDLFYGYFLWVASDMDFSIHYGTVKVPFQIIYLSNARGFPGGAVVENLPANAGDTGSSPGLGRSHMPRSN